MTIRDAAEPLGLAAAAGVHTGEIELDENEASGVAIHIAERIAARAAAGEVLASGVVADLVAGSGLQFAERAGEAIEASDTRVRLLAVVDREHQAAGVSAATSLDALSSREREVLFFVADGMTNAAIADRLHLSEHTVKRHVANILTKLDLPTRAAAAALAGRRNSA
jgi:DNA-binding NarL/FixJ family response regulator